MTRLYEAGELKPKLAPLFETPRPEVELYQWQQDLNCLNDLAHESASRVKKQQLLEVLKRWQDQTSDVFPGANQLTPDRFDRVTGQRLK